MLLEVVFVYAVLVTRMCVSEVKPRQYCCLADLHVSSLSFTFTSAYLPSAWCSLMRRAGDSKAAAADAAPLLRRRRLSCGETIGSHPLTAQASVCANATHVQADAVGELRPGSEVQLAGHRRVCDGKAASNSLPREHEAKRQGGAVSLPDSNQQYQAAYDTTRH